MSVRAVIFDFDLTLADSSAAIIECTEHALRQLDVARATPAQIGAVSGMTSFDGWARAGKRAVATHIGELDAIVQRMRRDPSDASR
ncbi:HAD hydrolase-like protein [Burkholderia sp. Ac-20344]|uniref:HAD family hydrolase n=1 Tax=Burkholderia sp. Ac-20344 TaxID=2703890 RepID=UPI00197C4F9D|nr:HAD hydrolase-like protein [Burkholderia sp. Ac-20344]MBN3834067.1 HAD family hydrolase [Burkholderia sp. Ac-20344]